MTIKRYKSSLYDHDARLVRQGVEVTGDYDFARGDVRKLDRREAVLAAGERAALSGYVQQVSQVDGPLLGQRIWLIQETAIRIEHDAKPEPLRIPNGPHTFETVGDFRRLVEKMTAFSDAATVTVEKRVKSGTFGVFENNLVVTEP